MCDIEEGIVTHYMNRADKLKSLRASEGDVISWEYKELEYFAEVVFIDKDYNYCVHVVYEHYSLTQDMISEDDVLRVWKQESTTKD